MAGYSLIKGTMNFCRVAFASFKRRVDQFFPRPKHLPEAPMHQITLPPASSTVDSESGLAEQDQQLQNEPIPIAPEVEVALPQNMEWPLVLFGFCLASAVDIALYSIQTNAKIPLCLQFLSFSILLAFASLFVARFLTCNHPTRPQVLEQGGIFFAVTAFFIALTTSFPLFLKLISWAIYVLSLLAIVIFRGPKPFSPEFITITTMLNIHIYTATT